MSTQVFISYSNQDRDVAESIHDALEEAGVPAWLAHRDLTSGVPWSQRIIDAIHASRVMILVLSRHANDSQYVIREVVEAVEHHAAIMTVRIEDVAPSKALKFFIGSEQWLDAFVMPPELYLRRVVDDVQLLLRAEPEVGEQPFVPASRHEPGGRPHTGPLERSRTVAPPSRSVERGVAAIVRRRSVALSAALLLIVIAAAVAVRAGVNSREQPAVVIASEPAALYVGDSIRLALQHEQAGVMWSSSDPGIVSNSEGEPVFRAVAAGRAVLRARASHGTDSVAIEVRRPPAGSIAILPPPSSMRVGDSWKFSVHALDVAGRTIASPVVLWTSETPAVVTIDETGMGEAVGAGRGRVRAQLDSVTTTVDVSVSAPTRPTRPSTGSTLSVPRPEQVVSDPPVVPASPTDSELNRLANVCLDALKRRDVQWIEANYHPSTGDEQRQLERLRTVMRQDRFSVRASGIGAARPDAHSVEFWAEFGYRNFSGANLRASGTFRVLVTGAAGAWRLASCRTVGPLASD